MATRICSAFWRQEVEKQQDRLEKIYGIGDHTALINKYINQTRWLAIGFLLFCLLTIVLTVSTSDFDSNTISFNDQGSILSIQRPDNGDKTMAVDVDVVTEDGVNLTKQGVTLSVDSQSAIKERSSGDQANSPLEKEDTLQQEIRKTIYQINSVTTGETVALPKQLPDGTNIYWMPRKHNNVALILLVIIVIGFVFYRYRDHAIVLAERQARESVLQELPEFVNKLVLLLNAGLVLNSAFHKIATEYSKNNIGTQSYFYGQLLKINQKCIATNGSVAMEVRNFAMRTGVVEFMRLANIISDSISKGADLMSQLKMEGDCLWAVRRKRMEEKGKLAETKLTLPLVILLMVLVMITIAPAMMEM